jgi:deoxyribonuclease (pyrimidine dimer)
MTRINCISISDLTNKHLLAEYKEITRPFNKVLNRINKYGVDKALDDVDIPTSYVLGKGHESFFFNKLKWLLHRYQDLGYELVERGFNINEIQYQEIRQDFWRAFPITPYFNDWEPTPDDKYLNMARLVKRSDVELALNELKEEL